MTTARRWTLPEVRCRAWTHHAVQMLRRALAREKMLSKSLANVLLSFFGRSAAQRPSISEAM